MTSSIVLCRTYSTGSKKITEERIISDTRRDSNHQELESQLTQILLKLTKDTNKPNKMTKMNGKMLIMFGDKSPQQQTVFTV